MIEWMQKHRKWLVITIWISAIAFIGAGGVMWGTADYSLGADAVAKVGKITISKNEFSTTYQNIFQNEVRKRGGNFDEAQAQQMNLQGQVLENLISNALIRNYALELGLRISDEEVMNLIKSIEFFHKDGVFSLESYEQYLAQERVSKRDFEEQIRNDLLSQKIFTLLFPNIPQNQFEIPNIATPLEKQAIFFALEGIADSIELDIIPASSVSVSADESSIKEFYEQNKQNYQTPPSYEVLAITTKSSDQPYNDKDLQDFYAKNYIANGENMSDEIKPQVISAYQKQQAKSEALKSTAILKKASKDSIPQNAKKILISQDSSQYSEEIFSALESNGIGATIKPIELGDDFITLKILSKNAPQAKPYSEVRSQISKEYIAKERNQKLANLAQSRLSTFKGKNVGVKFSFIELNQNPNFSIAGLDFYTSVSLLQAIYQTPTNPNYTLIGENAFLFRVVGQKILPFSQSQTIDAISSDRKIDSMLNLVSNFLKNKYAIKRYI
ncbi:SurA N-terminal domain-containing protein [Helicobacter sp. T3_23-1056]